MPSPFPGMDPYLESPAFWRGFHSRFLVAISDVLMQELPAGYYAEIEQHVWLEGEEFDERLGFAYPDAYVAGDRSGGGGVSAAVIASAPTPEVTFTKPAKKKTAKYLSITDAAKNRVITVIELLSPANKASGSGRESYLSKRNEYILSGTHLVEIDLLREGDRLPLGRPKLPQADYYACVSRAEQYPRVAVWVFTVRDPLPVLPVLPIPLMPEHGDVPLALKVCLDTVYGRTGHRNRIDYSKPVDPPLRVTDAAWAAEWLTDKLGDGRG